MALLDDVVFVCSEESVDLLFNRRVIVFVEVLLYDFRDQIEQSFKEELVIVGYPRTVF